MYGTEDERCPVEVFKQFVAKRPAEYCEPRHPFYIGVVTHKYFPSESEQWFLKAPVGENKLGSLMRKMAEKADLPDLEVKRITNTSVRKHLCRKLNENEVPDNQAIHVTGHKNAQSLNNYRVITNKQKKNMSAILSSKENVPTFQEPIKSAIPREQHNPVALSENPGLIPTPNMNLSMPKLTQNTMNTNPFHSFLYGATINGGSFNFNIYNPAPQEVQRKRPRIIDSDSDWRVLRTGVYMCDLFMT